MDRITKLDILRVNVVQPGYSPGRELFVELFQFQNYGIAAAARGG